MYILEYYFNVTNRFYNFESAELTGGYINSDRVTLETHRAYSSHRNIIGCSRSQAVQKERVIRSEI